MAEISTGMDFADTPVLTEKPRKPSFKEYYKTVPAEKNNVEDFDLEAAYNDLPYATMKEFAETDKHLDRGDKYKKPNHKTFSTESIYHSKETPGGKWEKKNNKWIFKASKHNVKNAGGADALKKYFAEHDKDSELVLPEDDE